MRSCRTGTRSPDSLYFSVLLSFAFVHEYRRDLLSELFNDVQVGSTLYGRLEARAPWAVAYPDSTLAGFHVVLDGECWLHLDGDRAPVHLVAGDFVVLPHGTPRELRDSPTAVPFDAPTIMSLIARNTARVTDVTPITNRNVSGAMAVQHIASIGNADSGLRMEYLCGAFTFTGDGARPLLSVLPDVIHVPGEKGRMMPWLESHLQAVACELTSGRPGASMVIARLSDVLFVQAVDASRTRHAARSGDLDRANRGAGRLCVGRCIYCRIQAGNRQRAGRVAAAERGMTSGTDSGYKPHFTANRDSCMDLRTSSHTSFIRSHRVLAIAVALGLMACTRAASAPAKPPVDATEYAADTKAWRVKRLDAIAGPDGWSTLAGLFWLDSTRYSIGSAPSSSIVLPADHTPRVFGTLARIDSGFTFHAAKGVQVMVDSARIDSVRIASDKSTTPTVLRAGSVTYRVIERVGRFALRVKDSSYVLRRDFKGLEYFPLDTSFRVLAHLVPHATPRTLRVLNVIGQTDEYRSPGMFEFTIAGKPYHITASFEGTDTTKYFVIFRDDTSRESTYPAGRFMYATPVDSAGNTILDFNRAYNPPCAFTAFATCPLPPSENVIKIAITAGEKRYAGPHGSTLDAIAQRAIAEPVKP